MRFKYKTGEELKKGDRVLLHGEPGEVEFVAEELTGDPAMDWYVKEFGGGVMVREPKYFGSCFLPQPEEAWQLLFISRG